MFCPLRKSEYRQGFSKCSDCRAELVATQEEARKIPVVTLWKGSDRGRFEGLLTVLQNASVPCRFSQGVKFDPHFRIRILGIPVLGKKSDIRNDYEIRIMQKDLERAHLAERESTDLEAQ